MIAPTMVIIYYYLVFQHYLNLLYSGYSPKELSFKHTAYKSREGKEILFFSEGIIKPTEEDWSPLSYKFKRINNNISFFNKN